MHLVLIVAAAAYGAVAGLLVPRPRYRLAVAPEEPWRYRCPQGHPLTGPAGGWLGPARCPACPVERRRFSVRAAPVAVALAVFCGGLAAATGARPELAVWLLLAPFGALLAGVDRAVSRLPDVLTLPMAAGAVSLLGVITLLPRGAGSWTRALLGGAVLGGGYLLLFVISPTGIGFGDVKLAPTLGVALGWYGWDVLFLGAFAGPLLGAVHGGWLVLTRRAGRKTALPFGPFMLAGAGAGVVLGALGTA
ncbi:prepilin peptidase [Streptomyces pactum]|uniref:Prepilin peptidase n=1 Tax=Streptomyces pactum TaxID=68249 RepID=A0ABS0NNI9_9ACTN|nr:A24 family peptidase [Streptomyces pactum]MBH5336743.1 prepilin peptidase [Streptomyces pactum]